MGNYHLMMREGQAMVKDQLMMKKSVMDHLVVVIYWCWVMDECLTKSPLMAKHQ